MRYLFQVVAVLPTVAALFLANSAAAETQQVCNVAENQIPAGEAFIYESDRIRPAYVDGEDLGSRVNVRSGPGLEYEAITYGLVGNYVDLIGQAFSATCDTWIKVRFPKSEVEGWILEQFIGSSGGGYGWWD